MNPYRVSKAAHPLTIARPNPIWWAYWAISLLMILLGFAMLLLAKDDFSGFKSLAFLSGAVDLVAIAGLFFYIRSKPAFFKLFWRFIFALLAIKLIGPTIGLIKNALTFTGIEQRVALVAAITSLWGVPLIYALWRYSFSRVLWRTAAA